MPVIQLTDLGIKALKSDGQTDYFDRAFPTLGIRVGKRAKTFFCLYGTPKKRTTLGRYPQLSLHEARLKASLLTSGTKHVSTGQIEANAAVLEYLRAIRVRPSTMEGYQQGLRRHFLPILGHHKLSEITATDILAITDKLAKTPTEQIHTHTTMRSFFNWCVPRYIQHSPMAGLKVPAKQRQRTRILTDDEIKSVWTTSHQLGRFGAIIQVCILTALRKGEADALQSSWVSNQSLIIPANIAKNGREHTLPLTPITEQCVLTLVSKSSEGFNWTVQKRKLDQLSGVTDWVIHDLRRTAASKMAQLGTAPHIIERILNHISSVSPLQATYQRYQYGIEIRTALDQYHQHLQTLLQLPTVIEPV